MNRERIREMLALRLYGELDPEEETELERVLEGDAEARAYAGELERGLGRLAREAEPRAALGDWERQVVDGLRRTIGRDQSLETAHRSRWYWAAIAGFAAGILVARLPGLRLSEETSGTSIPIDVVADASGFERDQEPPRSVATGPLTRLGSAVER